MKKKPAQLICFTEFEVVTINSYLVFLERLMMNEAFMYSMDRDGFLIKDYFRFQHAGILAKIIDQIEEKHYNKEWLR